MLYFYKNILYIFKDYNFEVGSKDESIVTKLSPNCVFEERVFDNVRSSTFHGREFDVFLFANPRSGS